MTNAMKKLHGIIDIIHENSAVVDVIIQSSTDDLIRTYNILCLNGCKKGDEIIIEHYKDIELVRNKKNPELILAWAKILSSSLSIAV